ncbi:hypothetical protein [Bosea sp. (in: a-proteobacteria)]|uniref:hypothetical protein n=1 Tax=Bosea sp. (in: a-proteobacteria) TaxID=1871050 RepID=UPI002735EBD3|nr:hypothetical protein [Bosea sp. (in: a-proteobacteria)]MDP3258498.1 hypothetical protein [Bosea sp. (in: a-proteobacteria)]
MPHRQAAMGDQMGLRYEDLDDETRRFMVEEIEMDTASDKIYRSSYLGQRAQGNWPDYIREAALSGSDVSLASQLRAPGMLNQMTQRMLATGRTITAKVPHNAAEVLAESEFNRYYARGLSRRAIEAGVARLQVYRAKAVMSPRQESERMIGLLVDPGTLLIDLRGSIGVETALGIPPGPGSGISVRLPKN